MNPRLRGALVGGAIGAAIGALYGFMFVAYRERMGQVTEQYVQAPQPQPNGTGLSPELEDAERQPQASKQGERMRLLTGRARELRARQPDMAWRDAMRQAAQEIMREET